MSNVSVKITRNDANLDEVFDAIGQAATIDIASRICQMTKMLAPVALGPLRNAYMWKVGDQKGGFNNMPGEPAQIELTSETTGPMDGVVGASQPLADKENYAVYQEFGTRKMAPQPHFRPAIASVVTQQSLGSCVKKASDEHLRGKLTPGQTREVFF
jgi:hypothetical protein